MNPLRLLRAAGRERVTLPFVGPTLRYDTVAVICAVMAFVRFGADIRVRDFINDTVNGDEITARTAELIERVEDMYGVTLDNSATPNPLLPQEQMIVDYFGETLVGGTLSPTQFERSAGWVEEDLSLYPPFLFEHIIIRRIRVVQNLNDVEGTKPAGAAQLPFLYLSYAEPEFDTFNKVRRLILSPPSKQDFSFTNHHEIGHGIDCVSPEFWDSLNDVEEARAAFPDSYASENSSGLTDEHSGYLSAYSMKGPKEDIAEIHAHLMHENNLTELIVFTDIVLTRKVNMWKRIVNATTFGVMDDEYWLLMRGEMMTRDDLVRKLEEALTMTEEGHRERLTKLDIPEEAITYGESQFFRGYYYPELFTAEHYERIQAMLKDSLAKLEALDTTEEEGFVE